MSRVKAGLVPALGGLLLFWSSRAAESFPKNCPDPLDKQNCIIRDGTEKSIRDAMVLYRDISTKLQDPDVSEEQRKLLTNDLNETNQIYLRGIATLQNSNVENSDVALANWQNLALAKGIPIGAPSARTQTVGEADRAGRVRTVVGPGTREITHERPDLNHEASMAGLPFGLNTVPRKDTQSPDEKSKKAAASGLPKDFVDAGDGFRQNHQLDKAVTHYDQALKADPKNMDARLGRAQARLEKGDRAGAIADAKEILAIDPKNQLASLIAGHGDAIAQGGSKMKLKADFGGPQNAEGLSAGAGPGKYAWGSGAGSGPARAPATTGQTAPGAPAPSQSLLEQAREKMRLKDVSGALMTARQAADLDPKNAKAWSLLADISNEAGNPKGALDAAKTALALEPDDPQALRAKAYAEFQLGDYRAAYADAKRAVELDPQNGLGYLYLAMIEEKLGQNAEALKDYERAVELDTTLAPLAQEAMARLRGTAPGGLGAAAQRHLVRGGVVTAAGALILLGLLGAAAGRKRTTTGKRPAEEAATVLEAAPEVRPGTVLGGNYEVTGELGRGGMGVVYDALDRTLQRRVAIKQLQRNGETTSADLERFLREARLVASLKHPHVAEIFSVITEGDLYLVFEYVDGRPLDKLLSGSGKIGLAQIRRLLTEVGSALDHAHAQKIIHRDLKPSNIMLATDGGAKVMDFGIAHQSQGGRHTTMTAASGTPPYMAPEQALGSVSKAADLYALAVMTYEMLTGSLPFEGPDYLEQKLHKTFTPPSQRNPDLRRGLDAFFARALDPDPTKRPADAKEFLRGFDAGCSA